MATESSAYTRNTLLAQRIMSFWNRRGHPVTVELVPLADDYALASDMVNGYPRAMAEAGGEAPAPSLTIRRLQSDEGGGLFHY